MEPLLEQAPAHIRVAIIAQVEMRRQELVRVSREIHANPELAFAEFKAVELLTGLLAQENFKVERGIAELPTAFRATWGGNRPTIAFLAEYDALAGIGHGCGHNLMGTASIGAGLALKNVLEKEGVTNLGRLQILGTPAEEGGGGKILLVERGVFSEVEAALIFHPSHKTLVNRGSLTAQHLKLEFFGKSAHAALAPDEGVNALNALLLTFTNVNALRQHLRSDARIHGIITRGGEAVNVIPEYAAAEFMVRASDQPYAAEVLKRFRHCAAAAAEATGARLQLTMDGQAFASMVPNPVLATLFAQNLSALGLRVEQPTMGERMGSTDMGNVSQVVPSLHPYIQIADLPVTIHTVEFREIAASPRGEEGMLNAAKALALTGADLMFRPANLVRVKEAFAEQQKKGLVGVNRP